METGQPTYVLTSEGHRKTVATGRVHVNVDAGIHQMITPGGVKVCMYVDRPGEYWTIKGESVPEAVAAKAGFQVDALRQQRAFMQDQQRARAVLTQALRANNLQKEAERGPYTLYQVGGGLAVIYKDGEKLTEDPAPLAVMQELFEDFTIDIPLPVEDDMEPIVLNLGKESRDAGRAS